MQAQVKQKASHEILSDCLITIFSHSTKEGGLPQNGVGGVSGLNAKPDTDGRT